MNIPGKLIARLLAMAWLAGACVSATLAAPFVPQNAAQVLERLPARASDAQTRALRELRRQWAAQPESADLAADLANRYYRLALRDGDPRYIGYAQAVLAPWAAAAAPDDILLARSLLAQFMHDFAGAERDLNQVLARDPANLAARSYRAILRLVQARYDEARSDCAGLASLAGGLLVAACEPTVRAVRGEARPAYDLLLQAMASHPAAPANERYWVLTRLAEIAWRLNRPRDAERHFRAALGMGRTDQYLLATYAEFLLDHDRADEVVKLLRDQTRNDVLLTRLALAEQAVGAPQLAEHVAMLAARIEAARRRGDELHLADEALFEMRFRQQPRAAMKLAQRNWDSGQREPADARLLLEAAVAAKDREGARAALDWLGATRHEDERINALARQLQGLGP